MHKCEAIILVNQNVLIRNISTLQVWWSHFGRKSTGIENRIFI